MEPEGRMGPCNLWNVCECKDTNAINTGTDVSEKAAPFPRCPWALDLSDKPFPGRSKVKPDPDKLGGWYWESGFDREPIADMELIRLSRLSVAEVRPAEWDYIIALSNA